MYEKYCGVPSQEIDVCPNAGWTRDFADPQTVLFVPFYGPAISPSGNANWGQVNDPQINAAMEQATLVVGEPARAEAWAKVDEMLVQQAVAVPGVFVEPGQHRGHGRRRRQRAVEQRLVGLRLHLAEVTRCRRRSRTWG